MLKIKVAILSNDKVFTSKIVDSFSTNYQNNIEISSFGSTELIYDFLSTNRIDVFLADDDDNITVDFDKIPSRCTFGYLARKKSVESLNGYRCIFKYQKADLIYREIISLFSENSNYKLKQDHQKSASKIITFISAAGGTGVSSLAAAYAKHRAGLGENPFYLNLETFGGAGILFPSEGNINMSNVIYSLKSNSINLSLKIESAIKKGADGVSFIDSSDVILDNLDLSSEEIMTLIEEINAMPRYNKLIIDFNFRFGDLDLAILKKSNKIILVSDGSEIVNGKTLRLLEALKIIDEEKNEILGNISIAYNKFASKTGKKINCDLLELGGFPRIDGTSSLIVEHLANQKIIEKI